MTTSKNKYASLTTRKGRSLDGLRAFFYYAPYYFVGCLILGSLFAYFVNVIAGAVIVFIGPFVAHKLLVSWHYKTVESNYERLREAIFNAPTKIDYFSSGWERAIALDVTNKIVYVTQLNSKNNTELIKLSYEKILHAEGKSPSYNTIVGGNGHSEYKYNTDSKNEAIIQTGLYLQYDDLVNHKFFIQMALDTAERWLRAFEKMHAGTLEPQDSPICLITIAR